MGRDEEVACSLDFERRDNLVTNEDAGQLPQWRWYPSLELIHERRLSSVEDEMEEGRCLPRRRITRSTIMSQTYPADYIFWADFRRIFQR